MGTPVGGERKARDGETVDIIACKDLLIKAISSLFSYPMTNKLDCSVRRLGGSAKAPVPW